jgi:NB-ARC domain/CHAT domain
MSNQPIILLTFAQNDLDNVAEEAAQLRAIVSEQPQLEWVCAEDLTTAKLSQAVVQSGERLLMYHFSGHASPTELELDDSELLDTISFSRILKHGREKVSFVFLNGCESYGHLAQLTAKGVKALIVTNTSIGDKMAMKLATEFYKLFLLHGYSLKSAFEAADAVAFKNSKNPATSDKKYKANPIIVNPGEPDEIGLSHAQWVLVIHSDYPEVLNWRLEDFINPPSKTPHLLTNAPGVPSCFLGREHDLAAISAAFGATQQPLFLVNGEGGIGKTTLAAKYWHQQQHLYKHLGWLDASRGIANGLLSIAREIGASFEPTDTEAIRLDTFAKHIRQLKHPILLVLDNADDSADLEAHFMRLQQLSNCHLLVTTRVHELADARVHRVEALSEDKALELFAYHYKRLIDTELALLKSIFEAVGYNTLVIELLAKNLKVLNRFQSNAYPVARLLEDLQTKGLLAILTKEVKVTYQSQTLRKAKPEEIIRAMYDLHQLSAGSVYLLNNLSFLLSIDVRPFRTLWDLFKPNFKTLCDLLKPNELDVFEANLSDLQLKGWIRYDEQEDGFIMSPVIRAVVLDKNLAQLGTDWDILSETFYNRLWKDPFYQVLLHCDDELRDELYKYLDKYLEKIKPVKN